VIESLVEQIEARYADVSKQMSDPAVIADRQRYADAGRQFNQLAPAARLAEEWRRAVSDAEGAQELLDEGADDPELRDELRDARASGSSRRRSGSPWSRRIPTTTRT
jgi:peptide chain release factor 1